MSIAFDDPSIRRVYDEDTQTWWFSVIDIVQVLTHQADYQTAHMYWIKLKERLSKEGSESVTNCHRLKLPASDGKQRLTDVATAETLLRLVQSVPSLNAEYFKLWLAQVGDEYLQEMADPALLLDRARQTWRQQGRSDKWITQRMNGQETRSKLPDNWSEHDKKDREFDTLTCQNPRDYMSEAEMIFAALAELSTQQIAESAEANGMVDNKAAAKVGDGIANRARKKLERQTGKWEVTGTNCLPPTTRNKTGRSRPVL